MSEEGPRRYEWLAYPPAFHRVDRTAREEADAALAPAAARSRATRGRVRPEPEDPLRTCWELDRDRILHAKAFRRLKHKTQVFLHPDGDHFVTRLTHTLQVTQIARSLARGLGLHETLAEAQSGSGAPAAEATDDWDEQSPAVVRDLVDALLGIALTP